MQRTRIKICGVGNPETALAAAHAGADAIGLVFVPRSPRFVDLEQARRIIDALPAFVEPVGLFVDSALSEVRQTVETLKLRTVQLHGSEDPQYVSELGNLHVVKALAYHAEPFIDSAKGWAQQPTNLAALLVDTPPPSSGDLPGGGGRMFEWSKLAPAAEHQRTTLPPLIVAGGLTSETVGEAIRTLRPFGVDVSSGVESARGMKDPAKIAEFCRAVRNADLC